jgi:tetratricopeptide (TPR) repeat protein
MKSLDPNLSQKIVAYTYDAQGEALKKRGDLAGAIKSYEQAAASDPAWAGPLEYTKAAILYASLPVPNYLGAREAANKALSADPKYALAYYVEGVAIAKNALATGNGNQAQDADTYLRKAVELAQEQHNDALAQAAQYFEENHAVNANLQFWSTQLTMRPAPAQQAGPAAKSKP